MSPRAGYNPAWRSTERFTTVMFGLNRKILVEQKTSQPQAVPKFTSLRKEAAHKAGEYDSKNHHYSPFPVV